MKFKKGNLIAHYAKNNVYSVLYIFTDCIDIYEVFCVNRTFEIPSITSIFLSGYYLDNSTILEFGDPVYE